jgi:uncharacterized membrane protein YedE/YeeE
MLSDWFEQIGDSTLLATGGAIIGVAFGFLAQRSRFCLRAAVIEFWQGRFGEKLAVWLLAFSAAVVAVQALVLAGALDTSTARQIAARGSLSGALIGGGVFGVGMVMTRGCASRLLILSANGNLRALLSGLLFAVAAQASLSGALAPLRAEVSSWWVIEGGSSRDLLAVLGWSHLGGEALGGLWLALALYVGWRNKITPWLWIGGAGTGLMVAAAWGFSQWMARHSFDPIQIQGLTFSGPSAEWLMRVLQSPAPTMGFEFGLLPGVFAGSWLGAWVGQDFKLEGFKDGYSMRRYIFGAVLMGFGAMLAGGCAVGAGITGGAIFALTAWVSLIGMWLGAGLTDRWLDAEPAPEAASTVTHRSAARAP